MTLRVLQVCPFGIPSEPTSGGQIRIAAIAAAYAAAGCEVDRCCVLTRTRDVQNPLDVVMPWWDRVRRYHIGKPSNLGQIRLHWAASKGRSLQRQLDIKLAQRYDVVHVEHPWGIELICQLREHPFLREALLICSAHNVEHELFESIVQERQEWTRAAQRLAQEIGRIEHLAAARSDLVWTVSKHDAAALSQTGTPCIVAPNGCRELPELTNDPEFTRFSRPYALFVGADYGPNVHGFLGMLGDDLRFLPDNTCVHTIGTCGEPLRHHAPHKLARHTGQLVHHGRVSQTKLDAALRHASLIILPISSGGGTNLKTAEALATGHAVLGTSQAFRGFEDWICTPNVFVENAPTTFRKKMAELLSLAHDTQTCTRVRRPHLTWAQALQPAINKTLALLHTHHT